MTEVLTMKKWTILLLVLLLAMAFITACDTQSGPSSAATTPNQTEDKLHIVTTIFPQYDWVCRILGERAKDAEITLLLNNGVDLHSYQPTAEDILKIATGDVFIYVGGASDAWVEDALKESPNEDRVVINLVEALGDRVREEEIVEGMEHNHDHAHEDAHDHDDEHEHEDERDHDHEDEHDHEHHHEADEHVWLSLRHAQTLVGVIRDAIIEADPTHAELYRDNAAGYIASLAALDARYQAAVASAETTTVLFGDRFPFRYLVDDYDLDYYAAFTGCSAETEASFETITFLAGKVDELGLTCVLTLEKSDQRIAETIIQNTKTRDQVILSMNSMQSTTSNDVAGGATYLGIMEHNLDVLEKALK
jgi:zinc transport system substrate-binding protein